MNTLNLIQEFLKLKRFAIVGVSRDKNEFSHRLFLDLLAKGYDVVPVNPFADRIASKPAYASLKKIQPTVTAAILFAKKDSAARIARECMEAGVKILWVYGVSGEKNVHPEILTAAENYGTKLIAGYCPYMFMDAPSFIHRFHRGIMKMFGQYPA